VHFTEHLFARRKTRCCTDNRAREPTKPPSVVIFVDSISGSCQRWCMTSRLRRIGMRRSWISSAAPKCGGGEQVKNDPALVHRACSGRLVELNIDRHAFCRRHRRRAFLDMIGFVAATTHRASAISRAYHRLGAGFSFPNALRILPPPPDSFSDHSPQDGL